jgi:hypothetical protein
VIGRGPNGERYWRAERRRRRIRTAKRALAWALVIGWILLMSAASYLAWHAIFGC